MKRYIVIEYDPKKCVEDEEFYDLYEQVTDTLYQAKIDAFIVEFKRKPTAEALSNEFGGKWK